MSFLQNNAEVIIGIVGILVGILLVREARHKIGEAWRKLKQNIKRLWSSTWVRFFVVFLLTVTVLLGLVRFGVLSSNLFWGVFVVLTGLMISVVLSTNIYTHELKKIIVQMQILHQQNDAFAESMSIRSELIKDKWPEFVEKLSDKLSFMAVEGLLKSAEIYDFTGDVIILKIPQVLEPTFRVLQFRIIELEPILEEVYGKPLRLHIVVASNKR